MCWWWDTAPFHRSALLSIWVCFTIPEAWQCVPNSGPHTSSPLSGPSEATFTWLERREHPCLFPTGAWALCVEGKGGAEWDAAADYSLVKSLYFLNSPHLPNLTSVDAEEGKRARIDFSLPPLLVLEGESHLTLEYRCSWHLQFWGFSYFDKKTIRRYNENIFFYKSIPNT